YSTDAIAADPVCWSNERKYGSGITDFGCCFVDGRMTQISREVTGPRRCIVTDLESKQVLRTFEGKADVGVDWSGPQSGMVMRTFCGTPNGSDAEIVLWDLSTGKAR